MIRFVVDFWSQSDSKFDLICLLFPSVNQFWLLTCKRSQNYMLLSSQKKSKLKISHSKSKSKLICIFKFETFQTAFSRKLRYPVSKIDEMEVASSTIFDASGTVVQATSSIGVWCLKPACACNYLHVSFYNALLYFACMTRRPKCQSLLFYLLQ